MDVKFQLVLEFSPVTMGVPLPGMYFVANSVFFRCLSEIFFAAIVKPIGWIGKKIYNMVRGTRSLTAVTQQAAPEAANGQSMVADVSVRRDDGMTEAALEAADTNSFYCDGESKLVSDFHGKENIHREQRGCGWDLSYVVGIASVHGVGQPVGVEYNTRTCGPLFGKAIRDTFKGVFGMAPSQSTRNSKLAPERARALARHQQRLAAAEAEETQSRIDANVCNPACERVALYVRRETMKETTERQRREWNTCSKLFMCRERQRFRIVARERDRNTPPAVSVCAVQCCLSVFLNLLFTFYFCHGLC